MRAPHEYSDMLYAVKSRVEWVFSGKRAYFLDFFNFASFFCKSTELLEFYEKIPIIQQYFVFSENMSKFTIQTGDENEILRTPSEPIKPQELRSYRGLADDMIKYIKNPDNGGVGLAAPQIWVNKRLIVVSLLRTYEDESYRTIAMINPEIREHSEELYSDTEGCLSVPGETGDVDRWAWIRVDFLDGEWKKYSLKLENLAARIVQHEIDHLDGILFTDKVEEIRPIHIL